MKFWSTLCLGTIVISAGMTYLIMHQGAQTLPDDSPAAKELPPSEARFKEGQLEGNVLAFNGGESHVGEESVIVVPVECAGDQKLKIELIRISCPCVNGLFFNGKRLELNEAFVLEPKQKGELRLSWTPNEDQEGNPAYRFSAVFVLNDPQFTPFFRLEVVTHVKKRS